MKKWLQVLFELLRVFGKTYSQVKKKQREAKISDVRKTIKKADVDKLSELILGRKSK